MPSDSSVSATILATARLRNHLLFAGMMNHGAMQSRVQMHDRFEMVEERGEAIEE
jgi:hypothetical protein